MYHYFPLSLSLWPYLPEEETLFGIDHIAWFSMQWQWSGSFHPIDLWLPPVVSSKGIEINKRDLMVRTQVSWRKLHDD